MLGNETAYGTLCNALSSFRTQFELIKSSVQTIMDDSVAAHLIYASNLSLRVKNKIEVIRLESNIHEVKKNKLLSDYHVFLEDIYFYEKETYQNWLHDANNFKERYLMGKNGLMFFDENKLVSSFNEKLLSFMNTARHLVLLKYDFPKDLKILVERRYEIFYHKCKIDKLADLYNKFVNKISEDAPLFLVMDSWYIQIKSHLQPGLEEKHSLVAMELPQCIEKSFHYLKQINSILSITKSYEKGISEDLELVKNLTFFPTDFYEENNLQDFSKTFGAFMARINGNVAVITGAMTYIAQGINLIEHTCLGTATGCHKRMHLYYEKYDTALINAFIGMVINHFNTMKKLLDEDRVAFVVHGRLINNNFVFDPDISTIMDSITAVIDSIPNKLKSVPRWLRTTNFRSYTIQLENMETYLPYSFHDHVMDQLSVQESKDACFRSLEKFYHMLESQSEKFTKFRFLSEKNNELIIRRFIETNPTLDDYGEKTGFFTTLSKMMEGHEYMDLGCIRLNNTELIEKFTEKCEYWVSIYGTSLISQCEDNMTSFSERIAALNEQLNIHIRNGQDILNVIKAIKEIKKTNIDADIIFQDIHDRYHFVVKHNIIIPKEKVLKFKNLKISWKNVYIEALGRNICIEDAIKRLPKANTK